MDHKISLDLGCGNKKRPNTVGVDFNERSAADIVHNLNISPYPFGDCSVDKIYIDNTLEHLDEPLKVMEELYRIVKPQGIVKVIVPYFRSPAAFIDPTHKHFFTVESFAYYDSDHFICQHYDYTLARFKVEKIIFHENIQSGLIKNIMAWFANKWPLKYEIYLSQIIPLDEVTFYLRRV
jgi:SAM-dependent methyltransferase